MPLASTQVDERISKNFIIGSSLVGGGLIVSIIMGGLQLIPNSNDVLRSDSEQRGNAQLEMR